MHTLPQVAGLRVADDVVGDWNGGAEAPELYVQAPCSSGGRALQRTSPSATVVSDRCKMAEGSERRPLTAEGSSVNATALRQLEREQMQQV